MALRLTPLTRAVANAGSGRKRKGPPTIYDTVNLLNFKYTIGWFMRDGWKKIKNKKWVEYRNYGANRFLEPNEPNNTYMTRTVTI